MPHSMTVLTMGMTVVDWWGMTGLSANCRVIGGVDSAGFFDLLIEGISLLKTERTEIGAMLDRRRGSIDQLIAERAQKLYEFATASWIARATAQLQRTRRK